MIGVVLGAVLNHLLTKRRERGAWLREQQVRVHEQFANALLEMTSYVSDGPPSKALNHPYFEGLDDAAQGISPLAMNLISQYFGLSLVAERYTLAVAKKVIKVAPSLAYQSVPLHGVNNRAANDQRDWALGELAGIQVLLTKSVRVDLGLEGRVYRWKFAYAFKNKLDNYDALAKSPVDRDDKPDPIDVLKKWRVRPIGGQGVPTSQDAYGVDPSRLIPVEEKITLAIARKKPGEEPWHFGYSRALSPERKAKVTKDAVRVVAGHKSAFPLEMYTMRKTIDGDDAWVWVADNPS